MNTRPLDLGSRLVLTSGLCFYLGHYLLNSFSEMVLPVIFRVFPFVTFPVTEFLYEEVIVATTFDLALGFGPCLSVVSVLPVFGCLVAPTGIRFPLPLLIRGENLDNGSEPFVLFLFTGIGFFPVEYMFLIFIGYKLFRWSTRRQLRVSTTLCLGWLWSLGVFNRAV
jgi:hypothetical protein